MRQITIIACLLMLPSLGYSQCRSVWRYLLGMQVTKAVDLIGKDHNIADMEKESQGDRMVSYSFKADELDVNIITFRGVCVSVVVSSLDNPTPIFRIAAEMTTDKNMTTKGKESWSYKDDWGEHMWSIDKSQNGRVYLMKGMLETNNPN